MLERLSFLLVALIFLHLTAVSQNKKFVKNYLEPRVNTFLNYSIKTSHGYSGVQFGRNIYIPDQKLVNPYFFVRQMTISNEIPAQNISVYQYFDPVRDWGIICQKEWKLEKMTGVPFRFRLGSLEYVDRLEAKTK